MNYAKHYDDHYKRMGEAGSGQLVWKPQYEIWKLAGYKDGMSVLDYGCGVGVMSEAVKGDYLGVDISAEAIRLARLRYPKLDFDVIKIGKLITEPFDWIAAQSVFTHTPKIMVLDSLNDLKQARGTLLIDILIGADNPLDEHVRHFTEDEWSDYLWKAGLKGEKVGEHDFVGYLHHYYRVTHER